MDENQMVVQTAGEVQTPQDTSPVSEPQTQPEVTDSAEKPVKTPETEGQAEAPQNEASEQSRAFQKMRQEIKSLKDQLEGKKQKQSFFAELKPSYAPVDYTQAKSNIDINNYVDPATGQFQAAAYNQAVNLELERNKAVSQQTASQTATRVYDEARAMEKYPQLNPDSESFDPVFEKEVAADYFFELYQGNNPSIVRIADRKARYFMKEAKKVEAEVKIQEDEKAQASLGPQTRSRQGFSNLEKLESLKKRSRQGDVTAIAERLRNIKS